MRIALPRLPQQLPSIENVLSYEARWQLSIAPQSGVTLLSENDFAHCLRRFPVR